MDMNGVRGQANKKSMGSATCPPPTKSAFPFVVLGLLLIGGVFFSLKTDTHEQTEISVPAQPPTSDKRDSPETDQASELEPAPANSDTPPEAPVQSPKVFPANQYEINMKPGQKPNSAEENAAVLEEGFGGGESAPQKSANASQETADSEPDREAPAVPLTRESVREVFQQNQENMRACYTKALEQNPDTAGKVLFHLVIDGEGHVQDVSIQATGPSLRDAQMELRDADMQECLKENFRNMNFPAFRPSAPNATAAISYPMTFETEE